MCMIAKLKAFLEGVYNDGYLLGGGTDDYYYDKVDELVDLMNSLTKEEKYGDAMRVPEDYSGPIE